MNLHRSHRRRLPQENTGLQSAIDSHRGPAQSVEEEEMLALAWKRLRKRLSECNFEILRMRLVDECSVGEVAEKLGLSREQVWYRYHRARREVAEIGSVLGDGRRPI